MLRPLQQGIRCVRKQHYILRDSISRSPRFLDLKCSPIGGNTVSVATVNVVYLVVKLDVSSDQESQPVLNYRTPRTLQWRVAAGLPGLLAAGGFLCAMAARQPLQAATPAAAPHQLLVTQYCTSCHNESTKTGELALDGVNARLVAENTETWEKVVRKLRARQMPPVGVPRPDEATYEAVVSSLEVSLDAAAEAHTNPGRTDTFRRLTRTEYQYSIRDLLALELDLSSVLPRDESSQGFDNITVTGLSPALLESYVSAADKISRLAVGRPVSSLAVYTIKMKPDLTQEFPFEGLPAGTRGGTRFPHTFPLDGEYEIVVRLARDRDEQVAGLRQVHQVEIILDRERVGLFDVVPPKHVGDHSAVDDHLQLRIPVKAGPHQVGVTFLKKPWGVLETDRKPYHAHFNAYRHPRVQPAVHEVTITGPYDAKGPGDTPSRRRIFECQPAGDREEDACVRRILTTLMRRAYRRPVTERGL